MKKRCIAFLLVYFILFTCTLALADDSALTRYGETIRPVNNGNIRMVSENVTIDMAGMKTRCEFTFKNETNKKQSILMGFPEEYSNYSPDDGMTLASLEEFKAFVGGKEVAVKREKSTRSDKKTYPYWHTFSVSFNPGETKQIVNTFLSGYYINSMGEKGVNYILDTGKGWKGTIGKATITYITHNRILPSHITGISPGCYHFENGKIVWQMKDFEPDQNIELLYNTTTYFECMAYFNKEDTDWEKEYTQSVKMFEAGNVTKALPVFEKLYKNPGPCKDKIICYLLMAYKNNIKKVTSLYQSDYFKSFLKDYTKNIIVEWANSQIAPVTLANPSQSLAGKTIVIDPGHQAVADNGLEAISPISNQKKAKVAAGATGITSKIPEYQLNLLISEKLQKLLSEKGAQVYMTRTSNDVSISNKERAVFANNVKADLVIKIHNNGTSDQKINGITLLYPSSKLMTDKNVSKFSKLAAQQILKNMLAETNAKSVGLSERSDLSGFNWSKVPVVIAECGFLTNPQEDQKLKDSNYQWKLSYGIVKGVQSYFSH